MSSKKGFTLIELLVVISIIALLLSIMMPSLSLVKRKAQSIVCRSNVRQLALAWWLYAGDNEEGIVGGSVSFLPEASKSYFGDSWTYSWVLPPMDKNEDPGDYTLENELRGIEHGYLYPYSDDVDLYHCKGASRELLEGGGYRSYSITGLLNAEFSRSIPPASVSFPEHSVKKITDVVRPGTKVVFLENKGQQGYNMGSWVFPANMTGERWGDPLAIWHGKGTVLGFADGHAELHKWVDSTTFEMASEDYSWGSVRPKSSGEGEDIEYMFKAYQPRK